MPYPVDPLVSELRGEDADSEPLVGPDSMLLTGYLGPEENDDDVAFHRLYPDEDLRTFLKVPVSAIRYRKEIDESADFGARSALYVTEAFMYSDIVYGDGDFMAGLAATGLEVPRIVLEHAANITCVAQGPKTGVPSMRPPCPKRESRELAA